MSKRVTQLTELTSPAVDDILPIVDTSTGITKKITYRNLVNIPDLGWASAGETWVYASATTFTVAGVDVTDKYPVGTKIRLKQGGSYKYFYIVTRVFSTNTTITVAAGSDYSLANSAITDNYFSYAAVATGFPGWFAFTPSWTNLTVGNGTNSSRFAMEGKTVRFRIGFIFGNTSSCGTAPRVSLPVATSATLGDSDILARGTIIDQGSAYYDGELMWATTTAADLYMMLVNSSYTSKVNPNATNPMTWTTTDGVKMIGEYEAA